MGNYHAQFLGGLGAAMPPGYPVRLHPEMVKRYVWKKENAWGMILMDNKKYRLVIVAIFYCIWSLWAIMSLSGCNQITKNIPSASTPKSGKVTLLWNEIPGSTSYNIYMSKSPGVTRLSGSKINSATNSLLINQLEPGETYYFVVTVVNEQGESEESKELSYTAVVDKIGLVYFKDLSDKSIQGIKATPERTKTEAERPALEKEALNEKIANSAFYIFFEQNSNTLSPKAIEKLDRIYEILANNSAAKLTLNGYTDSIGTPSYNQMVSEIRAYSVKSYLSGKGIEPSRMMAFGHGAQKFIANNKSAEGRRLNRRVEIELIIP
jgi:outer membrane protein OmpA-like peptidoglycan-associated protein